MNNWFLLTTGFLGGIGFLAATQWIVGRILRQVNGVLGYDKIQPSIKLYA